MVVQLGARGYSGGRAPVMRPVTRVAFAVLGSAPPGSGSGASVL
jgi:hypothetical protein